MSEIVEFLEARLAEDEAVAQTEVNIIAATFGKVPGEFEIHYGWARHTAHIENGARGASFAPGAPDPARVLREVAAKQAVIAQSREADEYYAHMSGNGRIASMAAGNVNACAAMLKALASVYDDHPDFNEEWRP